MGNKENRANRRDGASDPQRPLAPCNNDRLWSGRENGGPIFASARHGHGTGPIGSAPEFNRQLRCRKNPANHALASGAPAKRPRHLGAGAAIHIAGLDDHIGRPGHCRRRRNQSRTCHAKCDNGYSDQQTDDAPHQVYHDNRSLEQANTHGKRAGSGRHCVHQIVIDPAPKTVWREHAPAPSADRPGPR